MSYAKVHCAAILLLGVLALGTRARASDFASPQAGFLYGRIELESGKQYEGLLRWGDEESFWDDLFHSRKAELPFRREVADERLRRERPVRRGTVRTPFGDIEWEKHGNEDEVSRVFISRFGDIREIEVTGSDRANVHLKTGTIVAVEDYANDVGGTVRVRDASLGTVDVHWDRIARIVFLPTPPTCDPQTYRLRGRVDSRGGVFVGFIQWDQQECLGTDLLDGQTDDGDISLAFDHLRSIERAGHRGALVELKDGQRLNLSGTNDVNADNRGIMVADPTYGRVTIPWSEFDKVTFEDAGSSGQEYDAFPTSARLTGEITTAKGSVYRGRIVLDLDESEGWEILNGTQEGIAYDIPLQAVAAIERRGASLSDVELRSGLRIEIDSGQDVTDLNDGVLIYDEMGGKPTYLEWSLIARVRLN